MMKHDFQNNKGANYYISNSAFSVNPDLYFGNNI